MRIEKRKVRKKERKKASKQASRGKTDFILNTVFLVATLAGDVLLLERRELCFYYHPMKML